MHDVEAQDRDPIGQTRLHRLALAGRARDIRTGRACLNLLNAKDIFGNTALHCAAARGHTDVVQVLIEKGADVDLQDGNGETPLMHAVAQGHIHRRLDTNYIKIIKMLLAAGADINRPACTRETPFSIATKGRNPRVVACFSEPSPA